MKILDFDHDLSCIYYYSMTHSTLIPFSTINNISISVNRSTFTLVFFKAASQANPGADRNEQD